MKIGIRGRLLLLTFGISIPLGLIGILALNRVWSVGRGQLEDSVQQQAELAAIAFERWVDAQRQPLITIAAVAADKRLTLSETNLQYAVSTRPYWIALDVVDSDGNVFLTGPPDREPAPAALTKHLLRQSSSRESWVLVTDRTRDESRPIFAIAVPVKSGGAVITRIDGAAINELFKDIQLPSASIIAVFDDKGELLYRKQSSSKPIATEVSSHPLFGALGEHRSTVVELQSPYDDVWRVYGLSRAGTTGFVVSVGVPSAALYEPMRQQLNTYLLFSFIALVCAIVVAILIQRGIVRPIDRLRRVAIAVGEGDLSARAPIDNRTEIGDLASAFNLMASRVEDREQRLAELDRLKSEFVSSVSHELRTPLTTIKTLTYVLQHTNPSESERQEYLQTIEAECNRQIELVTNILDLSRIESGAYKTKLGPVDAREAVLASVKIVRPAVELRGHHLETSLPSKPAIILADMNVLVRVLCTLIENAVKYTPDFGRIEIGLEPHGEEIAIYVKDNGCGISTDEMPHIFERFYRGDMTAGPASGEPTTDQSEPGVGLGLYLVRGFVEQLHGRISVASELLLGSTFTVYLKKWPIVGEDQGEEAWNGEKVVGG